VSQEENLQTLVLGVSSQDFDEQIVGKLYSSLVGKETFYGRPEATIMYLGTLIVCVLLDIHSSQYGRIHNGHRYRVHLSEAEYIIAIEVEDGHDMPKAEVTILEDYYTLLESFGMSSSYKWVIPINSWVLVVAWVWIFTALSTLVYTPTFVSPPALSLWTFLNETLITAGVTMIVFGSTAILVVNR
jgi:hypothetical protein